MKAHNSAIAEAELIEAAPQTSVNFSPLKSGAATYCVEETPSLPSKADAG